MINGRVFGRQPRIGVVLRRENQPKIEIEFVLDTGFDGFLALPAAAIATLGLPYAYSLNAVFANDGREETPVHLATIEWDGEEQQVQVLALGKRPLLGTLLMDGFYLTIPFADGSPVILDRLKTDP